jgi:hypothetical protein
MVQIYPIHSAFGKSKTLEEAFNYVKSLTKGNSLCSGFVPMNPLFLTKVHSLVKEYLSLEQCYIVLSKVNGPKAKHLLSDIESRISKLRRPTDGDLQIHLFEIELAILRHLESLWTSFVKGARREKESLQERMQDSYSALYWKAEIILLQNQTLLYGQTLSDRLERIRLIEAHLKSL